MAQQAKALPCVLKINHSQLSIAPIPILQLPILSVHKDSKTLGFKVGPSSTSTDTAFSTIPGRSSDSQDDNPCLSAGERFFIELGF